MTIINLKQNSPEWLEFRRDKIGASDAPIIMGISPYRTPYQLYMDKIEHRDVPKNRAMQRGHELEAEALQAFEALYSMVYMDTIKVVPCVVQCETYPWMIASLDGYDCAKKVLVEIKCPGEKDHSIARTGTVPEHYMPQCQHQLFVTGLPYMYYFSYVGNLGTDHATRAIVQITADPDYQKALIEKELAFLDCLTKKTPPTLQDKDYEERHDLDFLQLAMQFSKVKERIDELEAQERYLKDQLIKLSAGKNCIGGRVKVSHISRKGAIDYTKIDQIAGLDLEPYRKPNSTYATVNLF